MSAYAGPESGPTTVAVAPTETTLADLVCKPRGRLIVQVENSDAAQTVSCRAKRRLYNGATWTTLATLELDGIPPLASGELELDVGGGSSEATITGMASGAGCNVVVTVRRLE